MTGNGGPPTAAGAAGRVLEPSAFAELLLRRNRPLRDAGFAGWDFLPGMRFQERAAWWRGGVKRAAPHAGLDLCRYRTADGDLRWLGAGAAVPILWRGEVVVIAPDFLGASVFVAHERWDELGRRLHSVYGHVEPRGGLACGAWLRDEDGVGAIADPARRGSAVPPHLHLTVALVVRESGAPLDWAALGDPGRATLLDPLPLILGRDSSDR